MRTFYLISTEIGIQVFYILLWGKKKNLEMSKNLVSRNIKTKSWSIHSSRAQFDPEKDKFCFLLEKEESVR